MSSVIAIYNELLSLSLICHLGMSGPFSEFNLCFNSHENQYLYDLYYSKLLLFHVTQTKGTYSLS